MAVHTGRTHSDSITFIDGNPSCGCHNSVDFPLVFNFIDGLVLPDAITINILEKFSHTKSYESLGITVRLNIPARQEITTINIAMDQQAYGVVLGKIISERNTFLSIVSRLLMQLRDKVSASEAFAIHQAIKSVKTWTDTGDNPPEHERLRELIGYAIDRAYRDTS